MNETRNPERHDDDWVRDDRAAAPDGSAVPAGERPVHDERDARLHGAGGDGAGLRGTGVETGGEWAQPRTGAAADGPTDWEHHDPAVAPHPASVHSGDAEPGAADLHGHPRAANGAVEARVAGPAGGAALFSDEERRRLHARWNELQGGFIDDPRHSVTEADRLVRDTIGSLHDLFERDRVQLEAVWSRGEEVSTEDLRLTLQRYRAFFDRLLSV